MWRFGTWVETQVHCSVTQNGIDSWSTYCSVIENIPVITYCSEKTVVRKISKNNYSAKNWQIVPGLTLSGTVPEKIRHFLKRFLPFLWIMCWSVDLFVRYHPETDLEMSTSNRVLTRAEGGDHVIPLSPGVVFFNHCDLSINVGIPSTSLWFLQRHLEQKKV